MKSVAIVSGLALTLALGSSAMAAITGPVRTEGGQVQGTVSKDGTIAAFRSIPYAAPPVGDLRWRPPQPAKAWSGVRQADRFVAVCPVSVKPRPGITQSEDCLFVNVWTGAASPSAKAPVMVWFHGSGDTTADPVFDGEALARKGVVVVTVEHRVGVLAGLATRELSQESGHNVSSNYGMMDSIAALKWVKANIAAFGGDPGNVTLFGQSHGAGMQHALAMSPMAKGLFGKMILESHARYAKDPVLDEVATAFKTLPQAEASGAKFMEAVGAHSLKDLRETPVDKLLETPTDGSDHVLDGWLVPLNYTETYARGTQAKVMVIAGFNKDETGASPETNYERVAARNAARAAAAAAADRGHVNPQPPSGAQAYADGARKRYGALADEYLKLYPATTDREAFTANNDATRDNGRVSLWKWAGAWQAKAAQPVYLYFWTHAPPGKNHDFSGAYHGSEISYVFNHARLPDEPWVSADERIGDTMSSYWTNFAKTGDPNGPGLPRWPAYDGKTQAVMELGDHFAPTPLADKAKTDFWLRFYETRPGG
jgi:para-nitrobenzyl esterase